MSNPDNVDYSKFTDFEIAFLIAKRDVVRYEVERLDELINAVGQTKGFQDAEKRPEGKQTAATAVSETTFSILNFKAQKGAKLGDYETAEKKGNIPEKFQSAFNILSASNATIANRYKGTGYSHTYWIYNDRVFRQKLKGASP